MRPFTYARPTREILYTNALSVLNTLYARFIRFRPFCFRVSNVVHTFNVPYVSPPFPFSAVADVSCEDTKGIQRTINGW